MYDIKKENKVYFYGFNRLHQLQGNPWNLRGDWITIQNIKDTAKRMLHQMGVSEVIVVDGSSLVGREYKDLTKPNHYKMPTEHIIFYDFLKLQEHFTFGLG